MNIREIKPGINYVGVNDRTTRRFESLWPLPYGVSYNSYIVADEKTALIDTVEIGEYNALVDNIEQLCANKEIDYLVVNHTEPDHSGSIPVLVDRFPQMKIICNKISAEQIKGFYHVNDPQRFVIVNDGDTVSLGKKTLRFITTPMVHWPETMMTYCEEDKVIFTGDALGCYGALNGRHIDSDFSEQEIEIFRNEMFRYYSNIVAKYGRFVQKALAKVGNLGFEYVCPTHGPVWHSRIAEVVGIYDRLSRGVSEKGAVVIFSTMYGNTAELVDHICNSLAAKGFDNIRVHNAAKDEMSYMLCDIMRYDTLVIGSPTYSGDIFPPVGALLKAVEVREIKKKAVGTFGSFTWAMGAMPKINATLNNMGIEPVASLSMKQAYSQVMDSQIEAFTDALAAAADKNDK